jgi:hypothetical protein
MVSNMLSNGRLPHLQVLRLAGDKRGNHISARTVSSFCPGLRELAVYAAPFDACYRAGFATAHTQFPQSLTKLHILNTSTSPANMVAGMTWLRSLAVIECSFTDNAMLALTSLQQLTELRIRSRDFSGFRKFCEDYDDKIFWEDAEYGRPLGAHTFTYHLQWKVREQERHHKLTQDKCSATLL